MRGFGSCALPPLLRDFGVIAGIAAKPATFSLLSANGLAKGSSSRISRLPALYSMNSRGLDGRRFPAGEPQCGEMASRLHATSASGQIHRHGGPLGASAIPLAADELCGA